MASTSARGWTTTRGHQLRDGPEERRHLEVRDQHHHPEQQHERPVVDGARGLVEAEAAERHHQDRPDDGRARAVNADDGDSARAARTV